MNWIDTLLYSFGSEAPLEVYWGLNELIDTINYNHNASLEPLVHPYHCDDEGITEEDVEKRVNALIAFLDNLKLSQKN